MQIEQKKMITKEILTFKVHRVWFDCIYNSILSWTAHVFCVSLNVTGGHYKYQHNNIIRSAEFY